MKNLINTLENFEFQKGLDLEPQKLKLLQQLSVFMILNDDYQKIDLFNLDLNQITDNQFRNKIETFVLSEQYQKIKSIIETYELGLNFSIGSLLFLTNFIDNDKDMMIYLLYVSIISRKKNIRDINYQIIIKEFFPITPFKKDDILNLWSLQQEQGEDLIYKKESWDLLKVK